MLTTPALASSETQSRFLRLFGSAARGKGEFMNPSAGARQSKGKSNLPVSDAERRGALNCPERQFRSVFDNFSLCHVGPRRLALHRLIIPVELAALQQPARAGAPPLGSTTRP